MFNSEEEFIMEIKTEESEACLNDYNSECSTITATESGSRGCITPMPSLCKPKKVRVLIKKLPRYVLAAYDLSTENAKSSTQPARSSGRLKYKQTPVGQYFALHVNKPLDVLKETGKKYATRSFLVQQKKCEFMHKLRSRRSKKKELKSIRISRKTTKKEAKKVAQERANSRRDFSIKKNLLDKNGARHEVKLTTPTVPTVPNSTGINLPHQNICRNQLDFQKNCEATRMMNPVSTILPNYPDVVITKYNIPPNSVPNPYVLNEPANNIPHFLPTVSNTCGKYYIPKSVMVSKPQHNVNVPLTYRTGNSNNIPQLQNKQPVNAFPTLFMAAPNHHPSSSQPIIFNGTTFSSNIGLQQKNDSSQRTFCIQASPSQPIIFNGTTFSSNIGLKQKTDSSQRKFSIQAFKIPYNSPKVLLVNQKGSSQRDLSGTNCAGSITRQSVNTKQTSKSDPLDIPSSISNRQNSPERQQFCKEIRTDKTDAICVDSESELELSDTEKRTEPEVIKRIIYHTKASQTKFTCNGSICGLVDSDEFNLNCFYCYDIFPLHKWYEFKQHIKQIHHVEEKENLSDAEADVGKNNSQDCHQMKSCQTSNMQNTISNPTSNKTLNNENCTTEAVNATEKNFKKLPLEPRLVEQRLSSSNTETSKLLPSRQKSPSNASKQLSRPKVCEKSFRKKISNDNSKDIITLDSDNDLDMVDIIDTPKCTEKVQEPDKAIKKPPFLCKRVSKLNDVKLVLPTMPNVTIKKVNKALPKESTSKPNPNTESTNVKEPFVKVSSKYDIQKIIKTFTKPTGQQLSANDHNKPRYFVVKKIIKLPTADAAPNLNNTKAMILTKVTEKDLTSIDKNEDRVPKPTNGNGILFGVTNPTVVIEFLLKFRSFPELWHPKFQNNYRGGIKTLCSHLNSRFNLNITELEVCLSVQRVKNWYCRIFNNIREHNKNPNNTAPYVHKFPIYFKILDQFLKSDGTNKPLLSSQLDSSSNLNNDSAFHIKENDTEAEKSKSIPSITQLKSPEPAAKPSAPLVASSTISNNNQTEEKAPENVIEFDADTLYDQQSSEEEFLPEFDKPKRKNKKNVKVTQVDGQKKKRTKIYLGRYECDLCNKIFKRRCDLKRHKVMHFPPEFECGVCLQKFYFKHWAKKCSHLRKYVHTQSEKISNDDGCTETVKPKKIWPKKIFRFKMICEICGASYRSIGSLNTHKRDKHLNQRHKCVVCNFTALSNWRIIQHSKKRHIVEPGTVEDVAKKSRARTETKTPFSEEARKEFFWRREMRKKLSPGEIFYGCCKCRIVFKSRKEKVLHNKIEHPITETTVICLLCLPNKLLLSNSNCARRHYTDIHKVPWHEIDGLVKRTKPIFNLLTNEQIETLKASANYKQLIDELLKDKILEQDPIVKFIKDEDSAAVQNLSTLLNELDDEIKIDVESAKEENVYIDGIIDHDYSIEGMFNERDYINNEHDYSEEQQIFENYNGYEVVNSESKNAFKTPHISEEGLVELDYDIKRKNNEMYNSYVQNDQEYVQSIIDDIAEGEMIEESIVVEEYIDEEGEEYL